MDIEIVRVDLLGTSFVIQTDESQEYIDSLVLYLNAKIDEIKSSVKIEDNHKLLILASLFLVDEIYKNKNRLTEESEAVSKIADRLISVIDTTLRDEGA